MEALKLITESDQQPKPKDWRIERVSYWREKHTESVGRQPKLGYGAMMGILTNAWTKYHGYTDEETGEIIFDIPPIDDWKEETDWFFKDKWAGEKCGYFFGYFIKNYGSFQKYDVVSRKPTDPMITNVCKCGSVMKHPRSYWMKYKNKTGKCASCGDRFNVNDVLNKPMSLTDLIQ